jgi:hypothetical protein
MPEVDLSGPGNDAPPDKKVANNTAKKTPEPEPKKAPAPAPTPAPTKKSNDDEPEDTL